MLIIDRKEYRDQIVKALNRNPITALLGPRQCGKTTIARSIAADLASTYFDLEDSEILARLENPKLALEHLTDVIIIDEIQRMPSLFPILRVLADRQNTPAKFLLLGSASPELIKHSSETLAGRIEFIEMSPFNLAEVGNTAWRQLWTRGGMPRSFLAENEDNSVVWRENFIRTFLERDIPALGLKLPPVQLRKFWTMIAHYHGQTWNASEIGRSLGLSDHAVKRYLDLLTETFLVRQLSPWFANIKKRQVKSPKIYIRDTGLLHTLLRLHTENDVTHHPKCGASWEGFAVEQVLQFTHAREAYYWATHTGAELDLIVHAGSRRYAFEFKYTDAPGTTRSMQIALETLAPDHLFVVYPGKNTFPLDEQITAVGMEILSEVLGDRMKNGGGVEEQEDV
jgi:predicted AAA+ superfamily ATPase